MFKLTKLEQETIILFNEDEDTAEVYTCNPRIKRLLNSACSKYSFCLKVKEDYYSCTYNLPKKHSTFIFRLYEKEKLSEKLILNAKHMRKVIKIKQAIDEFIRIKGYRPDKRIIQIIYRYYSYFSN